MLFRCTLLEFNLITEKTKKQRQEIVQMAIATAVQHAKSFSVRFFPQTVSPKLNWISTYFSFCFTESEFIHAHSFDIRATFHFYLQATRALRFARNRMLMVMENE